MKKKLTVLAGVFSVFFLFGCAAPLPSSFESNRFLLPGHTRRDFDVAQRNLAAAQPATGAPRSLVLDERDFSSSDVGSTPPTPIVIQVRPPSHFFADRSLVGWVLDTLRYAGAGALIGGAVFGETGKGAAVGAAIGLLTNPKDGREYYYDYRTADGYLSREFEAEFNRRYNAAALRIVRQRAREAAALAIRQDFCRGLRGVDYSDCRLGRGRYYRGGGHRWTAPAWPSHRRRW